MKDTLPKESIMIVDDTPENLDVLSKMLDGQGWNVRVFPRGDLALFSAFTQPPDLVLLDVLMPELDGYATCKGFKQNVQLKDIPIIFLSALTDLQDKARAFEAGGVDYVTKPFYEAEVLARVRVQLALRRNQLFLEDLVLRRTTELWEAHRRLRIWDGAKDQWLNLLSHEMRTPLTGLIGTAELLFSEIPPDSDIHDLRQGYDFSVLRINKLIDDALLLTQIDVSSGQFAAHQVQWAVFFDKLRNAVGEQSFQTQLRWHADARIAGSVKAESQLLHRAFLDLLTTASHCVLANETISVKVSIAENELRITISTNGQSLPVADLDNFFGVCGQRTLLKGGGDFGLAPALAKRIINLFDGECSVCNGESGGIVIEVRLPIYENSQAS